MTKVLDWAADVLATDEEFLMSVKKLWRYAQAEELARDLSLEDFHTALGADGRFEFDKGIDYGNGDPEERQVMEGLGFFSGERVKLAEREITVADIAAALKRTTDRMMGALEGAWEVRPEDAEAETQLLELLASTQKLQQGVGEVIEEMERREAESGEDAG